MKWKQKIFFNDTFQGFLFFFLNYKNITKVLLFFILHIAKKKADTSDFVKQWSLVFKQYCELIVAHSFFPLLFSDFFYFSLVHLFVKILKKFLIRFFATILRRRTKVTITKTTPMTKTKKIDSFKQKWLNFLSKKRKTTTIY